MVNRSLTVEEILTQTLGAKLLKTSLKELEQQQFYWLSVLPVDYRLVVHLRWPTRPAPPSSIPTVPHYPGWADSLRKDIPHRNLIAPILEVGMLHLWLLFQGFNVPVERLSLLAARGGTFAKYVPEDMDSISAEGSPHNQELKHLMHQHAADVLLGGSPWSIQDFADHLTNTGQLGKPTPERYQNIAESMYLMPGLVRKLLIEEYAVCLTHRWGLNASVWTLQNLRSKLATTFQYQFPLHHLRRSHHEQA